MSTDAAPDVPAVRAVVVNWNSGPKLAACVGALLGQRGVSVRVCVVDNASADDSLEILAETVGASADVEIVQSGANPGYGTGVNRGLEGDGWAFGAALNPDVVLEPDALAKMVRFLVQTPDAGLVGPRLLDGDGRPEPSVGAAPTLAGEVCRKFLLHLVFPLAKFRRPSTGSLARVGWVTGACMVFRYGAFTQVGGMDEAIFMYYEDIDFCLRMSDAGWGVYHFPDAVGQHPGKASSRQVLEPMLVSSAASHRYLVEKHLGPDAASVLTGLTGVEMALRSWIWQVRAGAPSAVVRQEAAERLAAYERIPRIVAGMHSGQAPRDVSEQGDVHPPVCSDGGT